MTCVRVVRSVAVTLLGGLCAALLATGSDAVHASADASRPVVIEFKGKAKKMRL